MRMVFDLVDLAELTEYIRAWEFEVLRPTSQIALDQFLPNKPVEDLDFKIRQGALNDTDVAMYRAFDTPPPMTDRPGTRYISGSLGPIARAIPLSEEELHRQRSLERGSDDPIVNAIYDDAERMCRAVACRIELARGDVIDDGKVTINENGLQLEADFGRDGSMSVSAGTVWTNTGSATPLTNLLGWQETYFDLNGTVPGALLMPRARMLNLALNAELRGYAAINGTTPNRLNLETINAILQNEGLPPVIIYDGQFRVDGVATRALPENKVFFLPDPSEPVGDTFYGITAEALKLRAKGLITKEQAPGIVACVYENEMPVQTITAAHAIALPVTPNPNLIMDAVVSA